MILSPYKTSLKRGYVNKQFLIEDSTPTSPSYFDITDFPDYIGGGKSVIKIKGAGLGLKFGSPIEAEVLDADGNVVYSEFPDFVDKYNNIYLSIYVYDFITKGVGTVSLVGIAEYDPNGNLLPEEDQTTYNIRWTRDILILPDFRNNSIIDFSKGPTITFAQILTPYRVNTAFTSSALLQVTSSAINYLTTYNKGYDFDTSTTETVLDDYLNNLLINPNRNTRTSNIVPNNTREIDSDITSGFRLLENTRFNTYIYSSESFFKKEYTGGSFTFLTTASYAYPTVPSNIDVVKGLSEIIGSTISTNTTIYKGNIIKVLDQYRALIDKPVEIYTTVPNTKNNQTSSYIYSKLENFSSSLVYRPTDLTYITSSAVSQSYIQFTFDNVDPIAGQIYRIKTFYKLSGQTGDYKLLNDQYIKNAELLIDQSRINQTPYARAESDFYLLGHFVNINQVAYDPLIDIQEWNSYKETPSLIAQWTATTSSQYLSDSTQLSASLADNSTFLFTTKDFQAYSINKIYTLTFNCVLEPGAELEVYANSFSLITSIAAVPYLQSFIKTENKEKTRYGGNFNRFGKLLGSIKNNSKNIKNYGRIAFDFEADSDGLGRPLFRLKPSSTGYRGWISEVSIKPQLLQGFTPALIQYPVPVDANFTSILSQSIDFKFEYYDYTGNQSEFVSYVKDARVNLLVELPTLGCQSEINKFGFEGSYFKSPDGISPSVSMSWTDLTTPDISFPAYFRGHTTRSAVYPGNYRDSGRSIFAWNTTWKERNTDAGAFTTKQDDQPIGSFTWKVTSSWLAFEDTYILGNSNDWDLNYPTGETASIDGRFFAFGSACCIDRADVNQQWSNFTQSNGFSPQNSQEREDTTEALRKVRLIWPHTTPNIAFPQYFTENGGIYKVFFRVKQRTDSSTTTWYNPDSGSKLNVYIHNANTVNIGSSGPYGKAGKYPPIQNIATITFDSSTQWIDSFTGYKYAQYEIELVQYGTPAQLVFEASGSGFTNADTIDSSGDWLVGDTNPQVFGGCIDDIRICKIGVTTDPNLIAPEPDRDFATAGPGIDGAAGVGGTFTSTGFITIGSLGTLLSQNNQQLE